MHFQLFSLPVASFGLSMSELFSVLLTVGFGIFLPIAIISISMYFKYKQRQMWHETARLALEKGQPLPELPSDRFQRRMAERLDRVGPRRDREHNEFKAGLILIAVGLGLYCFFDAIDHSMRNVGAIPGFIGVALVLYGVLNSVFGRKSAPIDDQPSQS